MFLGQIFLKTKSSKLKVTFLICLLKKKKGKERKIFKAKSTKSCCAEVVISRPFY